MSYNAATNLWACDDCRREGQLTIGLNLPFTPEGRWLAPPGVHLIHHTCHFDDGLHPDGWHEDEMRPCRDRCYDGCRPHEARA